MPRKSRGRRGRPMSHTEQLLFQEVFEEPESPQPSTSSGTDEDPVGSLFHDELSVGLDPELSNPDAVINGIRFGLAKISKLAEETIPNTSGKNYHLSSMLLLMMIKTKEFHFCR